jgi:hypothetical protein
MWAKTVFFFVFIFRAYPNNPEWPIYSKAMVPLKGFRDKKTKSKEPIPNFRPVMGKDRAVVAETPEYPSFRRRKAQSAGPQGNGRHLLCIANRMSMERPE